MRRAAKVDANQAAIVGGLIRSGCEVQSLAALGDGVADILCHHVASGRLRLFEIKNPAMPPSKRKLRPDQVEWHKRFPVTVVETVEGALAALGST